MTHYLIVGNGVAGTTAAETIRKADSQGRITILTEEDLPYYSRIRLPEYIAGETDEDDLVIKAPDWYKERAIDIRLKAEVAGIDPESKTATLKNGEKISYDKVLLATGSRSFVPPIKGSDLPGVFTLRNVQDARAIKDYAGKCANAVVIGGGVLGLEAGNALIKLGKKVRVVEFMSRLLPRQTDRECSKRLQAILEGMGFSFSLDSKTSAIEGNGRVEKVLLEGGESLDADMVIISAGVRPCKDLAEPVDVACDKAVKVDEHMLTSMADVYAAGDVIEFEGRPYGIWPAASEQGRIAGNNMAGKAQEYGGTPMANTLKVAGVELAAAGELDPDGKLDSAVYETKDVYRKIVFDNGRIVGCVMLGDKTGFFQVTKLIGKDRDFSQFKEQLQSPDFDFKQLTA